jgi:hypothetical protein
MGTKPTRAVPHRAVKSHAKCGEKCGVAGSGGSEFAVKSIRYRRFWDSSRDVEPAIASEQRCRHWDRSRAVDVDVAKADETSAETTGMLLSPARGAFYPAV